jgi:hypothetical protein
MMHGVEDRVSEAVAESRATAAPVHQTLGAHLEAIQQRHEHVAGRLQIVSEAVEIVTRQPLESLPPTPDAWRV